MTTQNFARLRLVALRHWKPLSAYIVTFLVTSSALVWQLKNLLPGYSANELATYHASSSFRTIWAQPLDAPYHILVRLLQYIFPDNLITVRLASVLIGCVTLVVFCILLYRWYGTRTAILGTLLFGTSGWFLHVSRLGTPAVMFFGVVALVACGIWLRERKAGLAVVIGLLLTAILLYTPGMVWFIAIGLMWQWKYIDRAFKQHLGFVSLGALLFICSLLPLGWKLYKTPALFKDWLSLPHEWGSILHILHNALDVPLAIFFRGHMDPETWLGRLPVLSIFGIVSFVLGSYVLYTQYKLARVRLLAGLAILGSIVIAITNNTIPITVLVPFVYVIVAVGASYLIGLWLTVFPRNPIARSLGIGMFAIIIAMTCAYNLRSYFVAWPQARVTRDAYRQEL